MFGCTKETIRPQHFTQRAYSVRSNISFDFPLMEIIRQKEKESR